MRIIAKLVSITAVLVMGGLIAEPAFAGTKDTPPAFIDTALRRAGGTLGTSRNSVDNIQYVMCYSVVQLYEGSVFTTATCGVRDSTGHVAVCWTDTPDMVRVIQSMSSDSLVSFDWDASGSCTRVMVIHSSSYETNR